MRLGAPVFPTPTDPIAWARAHRDAGYSAAYAPGGAIDDDLARQYRSAAAEYGVVIAEVGAWSNPLNPDSAEAGKAISWCIDRLALADRLEARCCVNIAGSLGKKWDGPHPDNLSPATFDRIVEVVRKIIDAVKPTRTVYSLETMPWMYPDSPESYLELMKAIDRKAFAVHLDPANLINCPSRAYRSGDLIRECFRLLGPHIRSAHGKDVAFGDRMTVHLEECIPGAGVMDYPVFLSELDKLDPDTPLMCEHLPGPEEYRAAVEHIRRSAESAGVKIR